MSRLIDPYRFGRRDPLFADVILLLHGDGSNGSTTFTDSSSYGRTVTRGGTNSVISTAQSKFGGASIFGNATGAAFEYLEVSTGAEWSGGDWCVEAFVRRAPLPGWDYFGLFYTGNDLSIRVEGDPDLSPGEVSILASGLVQDGFAIDADTWTHVAVTCQADTPSAGIYTIRMFKDGALATSYTSNNVVYALPTAADIRLGTISGAGFGALNGYVDEYRITAATRYTAAFTAPTAPHPDA